MATRVKAVINHITREVLFEQSGVSSVELDGGLWTVVFKIPQYFGQKGSLPLTNANYAVTVNYSQNNPLLNDDGYTDHIDTIEVVEDASWEDGKYAQFEWTPPAEASLKNGWLYFNIRIRDRQTNGVWSTKTKKIRVNPVVTGGSSSSLTPTQSDKIDELLDAYPVAYGKEQSLSAEEKYRARTNIGAFGSNSDPVPIRLNAEKTWIDIDEHNGWVTFLRGPYPQMLSSTYGHFDKPLAEIATRIFHGSPVVLEVRRNASQSVLPDICKSLDSLGDISNVLFYPTSVNGNFGKTSDLYPEDSGWLLYQEDDATLSVRFECHDPIVYKNVAVAKYKEYTYTPRESSTSITENLLVVEFSHEDLESVVVTVSGTNNSVASMNAFEIFDAVQNGNNVVLHWPMPNFDDGYYSCKLENSYKVGTSQAHAWFTTIIGNDLHWYTIDGDGNARASTVVPLGGGGSGGAVNSVNGQTPDETGDVKLTIPSKTSDLTNDSGFVTAQQAAAAAPVQSVNGQTGAVVLGASDVGALPDSTVIPPTVTEQTVIGWGFTKNAVRYDEQMALTDTQKATARTNIGAVGELEYDALESDIKSLEADLSLKLDAADAPTKVSDLQNDTGYITVSQVPAAPVQSVNGKTGSVTVNEVPAVGSTDSKKVLTADNGTYSWAAVPTGETTKRISLYKNSQTGVYTCSMTATQLHDALPNVVLATEDYRVPVSAYSIDKDDSYVKAVFIDDRPENNAAIVWTLSAASASDLVAVTREECSIEGLPDYSHAIDGQVLTKTKYGPRWANNNPSSGAALRLLYDGAFGPDDPDLMLMGNVANTETGNAIATALYTGRIGSAVLVDVSNSNTEVVYDLFAVDYDAQTHVSTVTFARTEGALIRTATLSGSTKTAPVFGTIPLAGGSANAVLYTAQSLTDAQKAQARTNVGAGTYSKPSGGIPDSDIASAATWNAKGTYSKPSGGIPASDLASGVIPSVPQMATAADMSDWDSGKTVDAATLKTDFQNALNTLGGIADAVDFHASEISDLQTDKADKTEIPTKTSDLTNDSGFQTAAQVQSAIAAIPDELPSVTAADNGKVLGVVNGAWAAKSDEGGSPVTVDSALSTTSENPVQNKVVKAALDAKQDTLTAGQNVTISGNTISADVDSAEIASNVTNWLNANVNPVGSAVVVDSSLSVSGAAADAKAAGQFKQYLQHDTIESTVLDVVRGKYVNPSTGVISNNQYWYSCEDFYPVTAGQIYSIGNNGKSLYTNIKFVWYDSEKAFLSSEDARFATAPSEAAFLRFTVAINAASTEVYENGRFVLQNQKYPSAIKLDNLQNLRVSQTDDRPVSAVLGAVNENVNVVDGSLSVRDLFDGVTIRSGYRCDSHGVGSAPKYTANASFWATDPIPVEPNKSYSFWKRTDYGYECNSNSGAAIFIYYNSALEQISNGSGVYKFTTPADCYFVVPTFVTATEGHIILTDAADVDLPFGKPIIKNAYGVTSAYGKKWLLFGDSITEINFRAKAHYHDFIRKELGLTVVNEAVSGAGYHTRLNDNVAVYQKIGASTVADPDLVTIMAGINDIAIENPAPDLGTVTDTTNATVMGCVYLAVQAARTKWPTVPLAILSPVPQSSTVPTADKNSRMEQFIALMTEFCRLNSIPFLDQYTGSPMRPWDSAWNAKYYSCASSPNGDGTHPNMYGHDLMHGKIREFIRTLL